MNIIEIFYIRFSKLRLQNPKTVLHIYNTSYFRLATFQVLNSHMCLVATICDTVALDSGLKDSHGTIFKFCFELINLFVLFTKALGFTTENTTTKKYKEKYHS